MKNMKNNQLRVWVGIAVLTIILTSVGLASAQGMGKGMKSGKGFCQSQSAAGCDRGPGNRLEMMAKRLNLSEEQTETITKIREETRKQAMETRKSLMRLKNELQGELLKDQPSEKTVLTLNTNIGELKTEMRALHLKTRLAVRDELTPEQRDQMLMMGDKGKKGRRHGGHGRKGQECGSRHGCAVGQKINPDCPNNE